VSNNKTEHPLDVKGMSYEYLENRKKEMMKQTYNKKVSTSKTIKQQNDRMYDKLTQISKQNTGISSLQNA